MFTGAQVASHNCASDCWIIISSNVYNVTDFLSQHPGGAAPILKYAGKDASVEFELVHSPNTIRDNLPAEKCLGPVDQSTIERVNVSTQPERNVNDAPALQTVISLDDFDNIAQKTMHPKSYAYYSSAACDLITYSWNRKSFNTIVFRPRVFRNVESLYVSSDRQKATSLIRHIHKLGYQALVITVDAPVSGKREADERIQVQMDTRSEISGAGKGSSGGIGKALSAWISSSLNWEDLHWIRKEWDRKLVVKGIQTFEDAKIAADLGFDGIYISNHGGRQLDTAPPALHVLYEIRRFCPDILTRAEIYIDGGIRRGTDVLKALCLGAKAVGLGCPFMYALSGYGTDGVIKAVEILRDEIETGMRLLGVSKLEDLHVDLLNCYKLEKVTWAGSKI
ncbi:Cytochrome b2, mitochondrial [Neolecta irregularis DAH-3]|uniref:Cytochrome b2, mitochondrial n=1 Tax=Neolecta irregularis (strain DAH-3) TaxID=1198029 RepID=A0A1U7LJF4_NEOID|nr:Cytochrome b2, mitochondrial [Neolecta irregularis DAH-3]|eukprot:OLL22723.1 Cytochrome b2, mitochondrial [Neolecta irregularis DAH-3]